MIRCIAIDDEPLALMQIASYIRETPNLILLGEFESAIGAISFLKSNEVDLMFVDINMPDLSGMDFVKSLSKPCGIIFTTAYSEYAVEGFKVDAIDYLLKPISYADFLKATERAGKRLGKGSPEATRVDSNERFLFIKSEYRILRIKLSDIKFIESMREYLRIHIENQRPVMTLLTMKKIEASLPETSFMRVHRSYIVNLNKITTIERNRIIFDKDIYIPISDQYKALFQEYLDRNFLI